MTKHIFDIRPKAVLTASETLQYYQRETIQKAFQCSVMDWYGNTELVGHATECKNGGMHIQLLHSVIEIVNDAGEPQNKRNEGLIVGTSLDNWAMPLIRYKVEDVAIPTLRKCSCGRGYPLVEKIIGRSGDYIRMPDGKLFSSIAVTHIFENCPCVVEAQLIQEAIDFIRILIVQESGYTSKHSQNIRRALQARLGKSMHFEFEFVKEIPRETNGKFMYFVSRISDNI